MRARHETPTRENPMHTRTFGKTGWQVSEIGFGAWGIGGSDWGGADEAAAMATLEASLDSGVSFFDTADVYGDGHSERLIGRLRRARPEPFLIATKAGRRLNPHTAAGYTAANLTAFVDRSLQNLGLERLDLVQLHCPPPEVYHQPEVFAALDSLVKAGKLAHYGVSVETVAEGLAALKYPGVASVQIIFNIFRQKPAEQFLAAAAAANVAVIARVPLASGLLAGRYTRETVFPAADHRTFNREGAAFDKGETFSGVDYATGLAAVERLRPLVPAGMTMAQFALKWILSFDAVSCVIPGARRPDQAVANAAASDLPPLSPETLTAVRQVYDELIRPLVHQQW
jgi:aryl-alcohol dehydrogenase-like predicted oxidoreductase